LNGGDAIAQILGRCGLRNACLLRFDAYFKSDMSRNGPKILQRRK
jgi:hypothetical protein